MPPAFLFSKNLPNKASLPAWLKSVEEKRDKLKAIANEVQRSHRDVANTLGRQVDEDGDVTKLDTNVKAEEASIKDAEEKIAVLRSHVEAQHAELRRAISESPALISDLATMLGPESNDLLVIFVRLFGNLDNLRQISPEHKCELFNIENELAKHRIADLETHNSALMKAELQVSGDVSMVDQAEFDELKAKLMAAEKNNLELKEKLTFAENMRKNQARDHEVALTAANRATETALETLKSTKENHQQEQADLASNHRATLEQKKAELEEITLSYSEQTRKTLTLESRLNKLTVAQSQLGHEHNEVQEEVDELEQECRDLQVKNSKCLEEIQEHKETAAYWEQLYVDENSTNERLTTTLESNIKALKKSNHSLDVKRLQLDEALKEQNKAKDDRNASLLLANELKTQLQAENQAKSVADSQVLTLQAELKYVAASRARNARRLLDSRSLEEHLRDRVKGFVDLQEQRSKSHEDSMAAFTKARDQQTQTILQLESENFLVVGKLEELEQKYQTVEHDKSSTIEQLQGEAIALAGQLYTVESALSDYVTRMEQQLHDKEDSFLNLEGEGIIRDMDNENEKRDLEIEKRDLEIEKRDLEIEKRDLEIEKRDLQNDVKNKQSFIQDVQAEKDELTESAEVLTIHNQELEEAKRVLNQKVESDSQSMVQIRTRFSEYLGLDARVPIFHESRWTEFVDSLVRSFAIKPTMDAPLPTFWVVREPWMKWAFQKEHNSPTHLSIMGLLARIYGLALVANIDWLDQHVKLDESIYYLAESLAKQFRLESRPLLFDEVVRLLFATVIKKIPAQRVEFQLLCIGFWQLGVFIQKRWAIDLTEVEQLEKSVTAYPAYQKLWQPAISYDSAAVEQYCSDEGILKGHLGMVKLERFIVVIDTSEFTLRLVHRERITFKDYAHVRLCAPRGHDDLVIEITDQRELTWWRAAQSIDT